MKKVMEDLRLSKMVDPANMPFDISRMAWAGFKPIVATEGRSPGKAERITSA